MAGNHDGGLKTAEKIKKKYGDDFYKVIGQKGGQNGRTGGFYGRPDLASEAGKKGGATRRRNKELRWTPTE